MAQKAQFSITLDGYHKWALARIADAMRTQRTDLIQWAVREWIAKYPEMVRSANATLADYQKTAPKSK